MDNNRGNSGWDNITADQVRPGDVISAVKSQGVGAWAGTVEFIDTQSGRVRFRFVGGQVSAWYNNGGTLGRKY